MTKAPHRTAALVRKKREASSRRRVPSEAEQLGARIGSVYAAEWRGKIGPELVELQKRFQGEVAEAFFAACDEVCKELGRAHLSGLVFRDEAENKLLERIAQAMLREPRYNGLDRGFVRDSSQDPRAAAVLLSEWHRQRPP